MKRRHHHFAPTEPGAGRLAKAAGLRVLAVGTETWIFNRRTGEEIGKWHPNSRFLTLLGRRVPNVADFAGVVRTIAAVCPDQLHPRYLAGVNGQPA